MEATAKNKAVIFGLVFFLSVVFFWFAINQYLLPSRAQLTSSLNVLPETTAIACNPAGECYVNILGQTAETSKVAGVTGYISYADNLEPVRVDRKGLCAQTSYDLTEPLQFTNDTQQKLVTFSVGTLRPDDQLKGGASCITTVVFKPTNITTEPMTTKVQLANAPQWKAGGLIDGVKGVFALQVDTTNIEIRISQTVPWPPVDETGTPDPTPSSGISPTPNVSTAPSPSIPPQCDLSRADCDCSGVVDLVDWERVRAYLRNEGAQCDMNGDGKATFDEVVIWVENNSLVRPPYLK